MKKLIAQLQSNPLYKKYELFVIPFITALLIVLMVVLVIVPNVFQYIETEKKLSEAKVKVDFFKQKKVNLQAIDKTQYTTGINRSLAILPDDKDTPAAISQLYYVLGLTNMQVQNIAFSEGGEDKTGKNFKISLELNGTFSELTNFILKLKETPRIMRINSLEVSSPSGSTSLFASFILSAYYEPLPKEISTVDQPLAQITDKDLEVLGKLSNTAFPVTTENTNFSGPKGKDNPFE